MQEHLKRYQYHEGGRKGKQENQKEKEREKREKDTMVIEDGLPSVLAKILPAGSWYSHVSRCIIIVSKRIRGES